MKRGFLLSNSKSKTLTPKCPEPTQNAPEPDRLSSLPEPILIHIVSLLPTDDMVRTSVLSRLWSHLWTLTPVLHFTRNFTGDFELEDYPSIINRCLSQCASSSKLRSLRFPVANHPDFTSNLDSWIRFSAARSADYLSFHPLTFGKVSVEMPPSLFDCRSLSSLGLFSCSLPSVVTSGFPSLRTLVLTCVGVQDALLEALLSSCPLLEELRLSKLNEISWIIVVGAPRLRILMVLECGGLERMEVVGAPELRRFMYCGDVSKICGLSALEKVDEVALLSTVKYPFMNPRTWKELVASVANARVLSVNSWFFKFPPGKGFSSEESRHNTVVFNNLKELHLWPVYQKSPGVPAEPWHAEKISAVFLCSLFSLLGDCPSLELLCLRSTYYLKQDENEMVGLWKPYSNVKRGLSFPEFDGVGYEVPSLKTLMITEFSGSREEMKLVEFVVNKAAALASVSLHYVEEVSEKLEGIRRKLSHFHRASPNVSVSFTVFDEDKVCSKHEMMWYNHVII